MGLSLADRWEKLPRNRKGYVFLAVGVATVVGLILGVSLTTEEDNTAAIEQGTVFSGCGPYVTTNPNIDLDFTYQGVSCRECEVGVNGRILLSGCTNICESWTIDPFTAELDAVASTCGVVPTPAPVPGPEFDCPEGFYVTKKETGCVADSIEDFLLFKEECYLLGEPDVTLEDCFQTCETNSCCGVAVASDGVGCFAFTENVDKLCQETVEGSTICKKIEPNFECFKGPLTRDDAREACEARSSTLVLRELPDPFDIQLARIIEACGDTPEGCWFDNDGLDECFFTEGDDFDVDNECDDERGYCCEIPTAKPTLSPTASPTFELFFVPECDGELTQVNFTEARACCLENGGDLAAIHSQAEQDFAYAKCEVALEAENNDCGCWIGFTRDPDDVVDPLDPDSFFWTDGSDVDFIFFEQSPEVQPNNNGDRDEACVHMRPFTDGGWNDLPCSGFCDAKDTKPFPLCRRFTEAPTVSPTVSPTFNPTFSPTKLPTVSPTQNPTFSPTLLPTVSPTKNPTVSPTTSPTVSPTQNPTVSPTQNPTVSPTANPTVSPTANPTVSPTANPTVSPTANPTVSPTANPTVSPTANPTVSPTNSPTVSPTANPTVSPTANPTVSPTANPTVSPTANPTVSPTANPTVSPTANPTVSPTANPTVSPTANPTVSPTANPTVSPTGEPTVSPTVSPTGEPTTSPTANPTVSPTANPTTSPTVSPTANPTVSPTANPTVSPTANPTVSPTANPTVSPTANPTVSPTFNPTTSPTANPTVSPTANPTVSPTANPTVSPTANPTVSPTANPTVSPTANPTVSPTANPTVSPTFNPTTSPTDSPTVSPTTSPTDSPTQNPTTSPTFLPTTSPTTSPTPNPTFAPTLSPFQPDRPDIVCKFANGEFIWTFTNDNAAFSIPFFFFFENPNGRNFFPGKPGIYPPCTFFVCSSFDFQVGPGQTLEFSTPVTEIVAIYPCDPLDPTPCFEDIIEPDPEDIIDCVCNLTTFFEDDFEDYLVTNGLRPDQSPEFFDEWEVINGTIDIKGFAEDEYGNRLFDNEGNPIPSSDFFTNPCVDPFLDPEGTKCVDIDGTVFFEPETNTLAIRDIELPPSDAFFNRICTLNFFARGNGRCGDLHREDIGIRNDGQARAAGCIQFYGNNPVPLFDDLRVGITEDGLPLENFTFEDIVWNQSFLPYGLTADVSNNSTAVSGFFEVDAGQLAPEEGGGNIGPLLDQVDLTCCCPIEEDKYVGRVIETFQGPTFDGKPVPKHKSDYRVVINKPAGYEKEYKTVYALGLGGSITLEFALGATEYIYIYEESYICCNEYDPEDAMVEVSVDGINFITVKDSFIGDWMVLEGGDYSIRKARVDLPNKACFKFIRITDKSDPDCFASDGFDLITVEVKKPCCPTITDPLATAAPTTLADSGLLEITTVGTAGSVLGYTIMAVGAIVLAGLTALTVSNQRRQRRLSESSILEPKTDPADIEQLKVNEAAQAEQEAKIVAKAL